MNLREILLEWNRRGLIQGPDESEEAFFKRCQQAEPNESFPHLPLTKDLFDLELDWVALTYADKHLHFWEGGCAWIEDNTVSLQLKKCLQKQEVYLGIYSKVELLAHECVHAARVAFEEPIFEEMLAYQTTQSPLRRILGPFFRKSSETRLMVLSIPTLFLAALFTPFQWMAALGGVGLLGLGFFRLFRTRHLFCRTQKRLAGLVGSKQALPVMVRLTDREIIRFAAMDASEILDYAKKMCKTQLRWKQIVYAYFPPSLGSFSYEDPEPILQNSA